MNEGNPIHSVSMFVDTHMPIEVQHDKPGAWPIHIKIGDVNAMGALNMWLTRNSAAVLCDALAEILRAGDQPVEHPDLDRMHGAELEANMP